MKRKIAAVAAAVALVAGGMMWASPAMADDEPPPGEAIVQTEEAVEPVPEVAEPVEEPVTEPVAEPVAEPEPAAPEPEVQPQGGHYCPDGSEAKGGYECPPDDEEVTPTLTWTPPSCDADGVLTLGEGNWTWGAVLNDDGSTTYTATAGEGAVIPEGTQFQWIVPNLDRLPEDSDECEVVVVPPTVTIVPDCDNEAGNILVTVQNDNDVTVPVTLVLDFNGDQVPDASEVLQVVAGETILHYQFTEDVSVGIAVLYDGLPIFQQVVTADCEEELIPTTLTPPSAVDECGTEQDFAYLPDDTEGVDYEWTSEDVTVLDVTAFVNKGYIVEDVPDGWEKVGETDDEFIYVWTYQFDDEACDEGSLDGSFITPVCVSDAAYLTGTIAIIDPDNQVPDDAEATITLTDGTNSFTYPQTFPLGEINVLWPGASVDASGFGVTWPGYITNSDGTYTATDDPAYFGWTRGGVTVHVEVNPEFETTVDYPPASPLCLTSPPSPPTPTPPALAVTGGGDVSPLLPLAGGLASALGVVLVALQAIRRRLTA